MGVDFDFIRLSKQSTFIPKWKKKIENVRFRYKLACDMTLNVLINWVISNIIYNDIFEKVKCDLEVQVNVIE